MKSLAITGKTSVQNANKPQVSSPLSWELYKHGGSESERNREEEEEDVDKNKEDDGALM